MAEPSAARPVAELELIDLQAQRRRLGARLDDAIARVLEHGRFILGPEVDALEERLARFCGAAHAVTCASGTDALLLALMARGVGPGDAVAVPAFTFVAAAEVVAVLGATPVFVDVRPETFTLDAGSLPAAVGVSAARGLRLVGVVPVDLFGQPADYAAIAPVADAHGLWVLADAAQSFGAALHGRSVGTLAPVTATSFFPAKPLGAYGDGGALLVDDHEQ
ncbi:MAG TPA: aminotransferase class I/II-fold pyridoxal phosphate-dependent enzyme, partial [Acidimicrobiales bacterium]|nr:aminotransferase class I/II-fold pyridoxal phosphate-dependent enzyme [Acidimicrobiales bacterium]